MVARCSNEPVVPTQATAASSVPEWGREPLLFLPSGSTSSPRVCLDSSGSLGKIGSSHTVSVFKWKAVVLCPSRTVLGSGGFLKVLSTVCSCWSPWPLPARVTVEQSMGWDTG